MNAAKAKDNLRFNQIDQQFTILPGYRYMNKPELVDLARKVKIQCPEDPENLTIIQPHQIVEAAQTIVRQGL